MPVFILILLLTTSLAHAYDPGDPPASFKEVYKRAVTINNCEYIDTIVVVRVVVRVVDDRMTDLSSEMPGKLAKSDEMILLEVSMEKWSDENLLLGPLLKVPSKNELNSLIGKKVCVY